MLAKKNNISLLYYLDKQDLLEVLPLSSNFTFHWLDWGETRAIHKSKNHSANLYPLLQIIDQQKYQTVWLTNKSKKLTTNLYAIYACYIDGALHETWCEHANDEILISLTSEFGPFLSLSSLRWIDFKLLNIFHIFKVLYGDFSYGDFKITSNIVADFLPPHLYYQHSPVVLDKFSETGIHFKTQSIFAKNTIFKQTTPIISIPCNGIWELVQANDSEFLQKLEDYKVPHAEQLKFKIDKDYFDSLKNTARIVKTSTDAVTFFIPYTKLIPEGHQYPAVAIFGKLANKLRLIFEEQTTLTQSEQVHKEKAS